MFTTRTTQRVLGILACALIHHLVSCWHIRSFWQNRIVEFPPNHPTHLIDEHFMSLALQEAEKAKRRKEVPIGAILVQQQQLQQVEKSRYRILASDGNRVERQNDASAHAELLVLKGGSKKLRNWRLGANTTLYSTLEPCPMCLAASQAFRVERIVYGAPDLRLGAIESHICLLDMAQHPTHTISEVVKDVNASESAAMLRAFFRERRKDAKERKRQLKASEAARNQRQS